MNSATKVIRIGFGGRTDHISPNLVIKDREFGWGGFGGLGVYGA